MRTCAPKLDPPECQPVSTVLLKEEGCLFYAKDPSICPGFYVRVFIPFVETSRMHCRPQFHAAGSKARTCRAGPKTEEQFKWTYRAELGARHASAESQVKSHPKRCRITMLHYSRNRNKLAVDTITVPSYAATALPVRQVSHFTTGVSFCHKQPRQYKNATFLNTRCISIIQCA